MSADIDCLLIIALQDKKLTQSKGTFNQGLCSYKDLPSVKQSKQYSNQTTKLELKQEYDVSQVVSYTGMMKGKEILLGYDFLSLHITLNMILGPIYLNLDLGLSN